MGKEKNTWAVWVTGNWHVTFRFVGADVIAVDYLDMAPEGIPEVEAMYKYSDKFGSGSNFNALLVEMDQNGLLDPDVIKAIYDMEEEMRNAIF